MKTSSTNRELPARSGLGPFVVEGVPVESIRAQLEKILTSTSFLHSERLCRLLRFTVEQTIQGRGDELKEYLLAVEVFDKDASFDPRIDSIVRVEAGRLRSKLREYYQTEGREDPVNIESRKGSYAPVFHGRATPVAEAAPIAAQVPFWRQWKPTALAVCALLAAIAVYWASRSPRNIFSLQRELATGLSSEGKRPRTSPRVDPASIAVLPFMNLSAEKENEYFSDGLSEELIHALTQVDGLRVVSQTSAFQFKGKAHDIRTIGEQLRVAVILEGSVRKSGDRLRVTAQLIRAADGYHLWSERYDREMKDVFAIQEEIARTIVNKLKIPLADEQSRRLGKPPTDNLEAFGLYLKGRYYWNKWDEEGFKKGLDYFQQAIEADPNYALAWVGLADVYYGLSNLYLAPREAMPKARAAARKALEIDDTLGEAHAVLAMIMAQYDWAWADAETKFKRAVQLNPGYGSAHHWYGTYLVEMGRFEEALQELRRAEQLDPLSPSIAVTALWPFYFGRRPDEAVEPLIRTIAMAPEFLPAHALLGRVYDQKSMYREAIAELEKSSRDDDPPHVGSLGHAYAKSGRRAEAHKVLDRLKQLSRRTYVSPSFVAIVYAGLGEKDRAFEMLEKAYEERSEDLALLKVDPLLDDLRADPRFAALLKRMNLL